MVLLPVVADSPLALALTRGDKTTKDPFQHWRSGRRESVSVSLDGPLSTGGGGAGGGGGGGRPQIPSPPLSLSLSLSLLFQKCIPRYHPRQDARARAMRQSDVCVCVCVST